MKPVMILTLLTLATFTLPLAGAEQHQSDCSNAVEQQVAATQDYSNAAKDFNEKNNPSDYKPQACVGGTIRWEETSFKMDIPEFTFKETSWKMDVPETKMVNQEWWIKEPFVKCEDKKTGQYPQTTCKDTWITVGGFKTKGVPECTVTWHDIITTVCWPETRDKRVVVGVPEFKMGTQEFRMHLPQVTMKTQEIILHLPQFYADSGCIGSDCAEKCKNEIDAHMAEIDQNRIDALGPKKQNLITKTGDMFQCQEDTLGIQKQDALAEFDKYISVAKASLEAMRVNGLTEAAQKQQTQLEQMLTQRQHLVAQMDTVIENLQAQKKKAVDQLANS